MKRRNLDQSGFEVLGVILVLVFIAVVAFAGYTILKMNKADGNIESSSVPATTVQPPATIKTNADLTQTGKSLDTTGTELDSILNDKSLDADMNSML